MKLLFVYGTLKQGKHNHHFLEHQRYVGHAHTRYHNYRLVVCQLPFLVRVATGCGESIHGELYSVSDKVFRHIEAIEEHFYDKRVITVVDGYGQDRKAFCFEAKPRVVQQRKLLKLKHISNF